MFKQLLRAEDVSRMLNISLATVYYYARQKILPSIRVGSKIRFRDKDIYQLLKKGKNKVGE
jgi:excisionase family DNA binding protein